MIKNFKKESKFVAICALLLAMVLSFGAGIAGAYVMANPSPAENDMLPTVESEIVFNLDTADAGENDIPVISGDLELHIPFISANQEILVGRLDLEEGQVYQVSVEAAEGIDVFAGVRINTPRSPLWSPFSSSGNTGSVTVPITHRDRPSYLFVGSNELSSVATDLTNVTIRVTMLDE
jgi:hypothetical protein